MNEISKHYTVQEVAEALSVAPHTILRLIKVGELSAVRVGQQWRIPAEAIRNLGKAPNDR